MSANLYHYKMYAECAHDVGVFIQLVRPLTLTMAPAEPGWNEPDVEFCSHLTLQELRDMMREIVDGHSMRESLNYADKYTGERVELTP